MGPVNLLQQIQQSLTGRISGSATPILVSSSVHYIPSLWKEQILFLVAIFVRPLSYKPPREKRMTVWTLTSARWFTSQDLLPWWSNVIMLHLLCKYSLLL